ncbi:hypothetical protein L6452_00974 [Arctium lappa]|uniref:Uncharacterized protein n=1 Tax=Arctium lappa TaxID=4217 RepID=A0ACB9FFF1_ARCLA|nr:hypothetical protein L6452_00974 [Arctium lappa]
MFSPHAHPPFSPLHNRLHNSFFALSADLIVLISRALDEEHWFRSHAESDLRAKNVEISPMIYKAVIELYVSFHGDDEFWYMNPPYLYIQVNNLHIGKTHGTYREVLVTIDEKLGASLSPPQSLPASLGKTLKSLPGKTIL